MTERDLKERKAEFRGLHAKKRNEWTNEQRQQWSSAACKHAIEWLQERRIETIMAYIAFRSELDLTELIEWGWKAGKDILVPRCVESDRSMTLHPLRSWDELMRGAYGIMEPNPAATLPIDDGFVPEVVFVPGLAFDRSGGRIGYGGGYYDRFGDSIRAGGKKALWVGVGYEAQLAEDIPLEAHDLRMDYRLSEHRLLAVEQKAGRGLANGIDAF